MKDKAEQVDIGCWTMAEMSKMLAKLVVELDPEVIREVLQKEGVWKRVIGEE